MRGLLEARKKKTLEALKLAESLEFPVKRREGATYSVPVTRKRVVVDMPKPKAGSYAPEPELRPEIYEDVLRVIKSLSITMERSPSAFAAMGEEHLRDHILVSLNGQFEGAATSETFNRSGKTDILIRVKDRNVFIAECKFWDGEVSDRRPRPGTLVPILARYKGRADRVQSPQGHLGRAGRHP